MGGEKVFRDFIEELTGEGIKKKPPILINRPFYENLISRIILFRNLEKIYGDGKKKIGNLRAAVIPYSVSVLYNYTDGSKDDIMFDLDKIWIKEGLEQDLSEYLYELMKLMNDLIKKYSTSDDPSENSKTKELWERISESKEILNFMGDPDTKKIIKKYSITKDEYKKRLLKIAKTAEVNFKLIQDNVSIHANGKKFYEKLLAIFQKFSHNDKERLEFIISSIFTHKDLDQKHIGYERELINKIIVESPEIFDSVTTNTDNFYYEALDHTIDLYNGAINNQEDVKKVFEKVQDNCKTKKLKNHSIWGSIGESLIKGDAPKMADIIAASSLFSEEKAPVEKEKQIISESLLIKMIEWDSRKKMLSKNEIQYLSEFAYQSKKINSFHENNIRRHLQTLINGGFTVVEK